MNSPLVVLSHREPYVDRIDDDGRPVLRLKTNGVFRTLDKVMRRRHGTWLAWRELDEDQPFEERIRVPAADSRDGYDVRRIPLSPADARRFYYDFTSTAIWPVLFSLLDRARFTGRAWRTYKEVNAKFAEAAAEEAGEGALIWVNDFHLMLVPRMLREMRPDLTLALFLHTTFPPPDVFGVIPWREQLLDGLLHLDLIGCHIPSYVRNFADTAERFMGATPGPLEAADFVRSGPAVAIATYPRSLEYDGRTVHLGAYPVGVDVGQLERLARSDEVAKAREDIRRRANAPTIIMSAERLDYVKGMIERLECFERFLERHPERRGEVAFMQIAVPTRTGMDEFQTMRRLTEEAVGRINGRFGTLDWTPVHHFYTSFPLEKLAGFYAAADVAWVTPLRDGLNLVSKEYVASRVDGDGVVILSEFAGAAAELRGAVLANPYSPDSMDHALDRALRMPESERRTRMMRLRRRVVDYDVRRWARQFLGAAESLQRRVALPVPG